MRQFAFLALMALAACAATERAIIVRGPQTPAENAEMQRLQGWAGSLKDRLILKNKDLCIADDARCTLPMTISFSDVLGAFSSADGITITVPLLHDLKNDDELAVILGHEQAHRLLHHVDNHSRLDAGDERKADCVGSFLAYRAGFDPVLGSDTMRRIALGESGQARGPAAFRVFGGGAKQDWSLRRQTIIDAAASARGVGVSAVMIETACGVML